MSCIFYKSIIEDEMKAFGIKKDSLKVAANSVGTTYSRKALTKGKTFLDYNLPSNRCAYLYKYASIHTGLVAKYFSKLIKKKEVKSVLNRKDSFKICCLGGGPGTDIVGLFKVLARYPQYQNKVVEVTVLDICGGWRNSFKRVISNLISGKVKDISDNFVDIKNFKFKLLEVNLLNNLPANVVTVLSEADIVCMIKFVSAILGLSSSVSALKTIGAKLKIDAVVLFIDNFQGNVFKPLADIAGQVGLKIVIGPLHESFKKGNGFIQAPTTVAEKEMFGCMPLFSTRVTVLALMKVAESCIIDSSNNVNICQPVEVGDDDSWDTDEECEITNDILSVSPKNVTKTTCDKFSQTYIKYIPENGLNASSNTESQVEPHNLKEINSLVDALSDLVNVMNQWHEHMKMKMHCCHCH